MSGQFNTLCPERTLFTTNTASLLPSRFADATGRAARCCALHFHDLTLSRVVDVMPHPGRGPHMVDVVRAFAGRIGQVPIVLKKEHSGPECRRRQHPPGHATIFALTDATGVWIM